MSSYQQHEGHSRGHRIRKGYDDYEDHMHYKGKKAKEKSAKKGKPSRRDRMSARPEKFGIDLSID